MLNILNAYIHHRIIFLIFVIIAGASASMAKTYDLFGLQIKQFELFIGGDLVLHFFVSFLLGFSAMWATPNQYRSRPYPILNYLILLVLALVSIDECMQLFSTLRHFSFADLATNTFGIISGAVLFNVIIRYIK